MWRLPAVHINTTWKRERKTVPHELAEGFIVGEFPVVLLCEGMINILQTPLLRQLGRGLLLYRLLRRNRQLEQRDNRSHKGGPATEDLGALPLLFLPDCCLGPHRLFSSSWFSSPSFLYVSSFSSSLQIHSRWLHCPSSRRSLFLCLSLCLHRCPEEETKEEDIERRCNAVRTKKEPQSMTA